MKQVIKSKALCLIIRYIFSCFSAAEAEAEALKDAEEGNQPSKLEECKYYTSLLLGTFSIVSVFAFLFLVPFVLDPAISTLRHDFVDDPVTCKVTNLSVKAGKYSRDNPNSLSLNIKLIKNQISYPCILLNFSLDFLKVYFYILMNKEGFLVKTLFSTLGITILG